MWDAVGTWFVLSLSALGAGAVNAIAGGGTILTFPALISVVSSKVANQTSTVALVPGSLAGAWALRREMQPVRRWLVLLAPPSLLGGIVGSILATVINPKIFDILVPWLILLAAMLFAFQPALTRLQAADTPREPSTRSRVAIVLFQFLVSVYGGFFGAGIGILMLAALGAMGLNNIHEMNAVKNALAVLINGVSVVVFVAVGDIAWHYAGVLAVAAVIGAYFASRFARRLKPAHVRSIVTVIGFGLAAVFFYRQWF